MVICGIDSHARLRLACVGARCVSLRTRGQDRLESPMGRALPRLITLVGPARAKRITIMCEKMHAAQAAQLGIGRRTGGDWANVGEGAGDG
jgi:hypothetical protein